MSSFTCLNRRRVGSPRKAYNKRSSIARRKREVHLRLQVPVLGIPCLSQKKSPEVVGEMPCHLPAYWLDCWTRSLPLSIRKPWYSLCSVYLQPRGKRVWSVGSWWSNWPIMVTNSKSSGHLPRLLTSSISLSNALWMESGTCHESIDCNENTKS